MKGIDRAVDIRVAICESGPSEIFPPFRITITYFTVVQINIHEAEFVIAQKLVFLFFPRKNIWYFEYTV